MSIEQIEREERTAEWIGYPGSRKYGPGLTRDEASLRHDAYLRSGWSCESSTAYHAIRMAPASEPGPTWRAANPDVRIGVDPWRKGPTARE